LPKRAGQRSLRVLLTGAVAEHPPEVLTYPRSSMAAIWGSTRGRA